MNSGHFIRYILFWLNSCDLPVQELCAAICLCLHPLSYKRIGHKQRAAPTQVERNGEWTSNKKQETLERKESHLSLTSLPQKPLVLLLCWRRLNTWCWCNTLCRSWEGPEVWIQRTLEQRHDRGLEVGAVLLSVHPLFPRSHPGRERRERGLQRSPARGWAPDGV